MDKQLKRQASLNLSLGNDDVEPQQEQQQIFYRQSQEKVMTPIKTQQQQMFSEFSEDQNQFLSPRNRKLSSSESEKEPNDEELQFQKKVDEQNNAVQKSQMLFAKEIQDKINEETRDSVILNIKKNCASNEGGAEINPFDVFIQFDDPQNDFQLRILDLETALQEIRVTLDEKQYDIIMKYYRIKNTDYIAIMKLCAAICDDLGELFFLAINYFINKYRILPEILFEEVGGQEKTLSLASLNQINQELQWHLDPNKVQRGYNGISDYGNYPVDYRVFISKLNEINTKHQSKLYEMNYAKLKRSIIQAGQGNIDGFKALVESFDELNTGQLQFQSFIDLLTMYLNRMLSKQEIRVIQVYLIDYDKDDQIVMYHKLIVDCQKFVDEKMEQEKLEQEKQRKADTETIYNFFHSFNDNQHVEESLFTGEKKYQIDRENFINKCKIQVGFKQEEDKIEWIYDNITKDKLLDKGYIKVNEFREFYKNIIAEYEKILEERNKGKEIQEEDKNDKRQGKVQSKGLRADISAFFYEVDSDKKGYITQQELYTGMMKIGIILSTQEVTKFKSYDYYAFEKIVLKYLSQRWYNVNKIIYNIKKDYDNLRIKDDYKLTMQQLKFLTDFQRFGLKYDEIVYIFQIFDPEKKGYIRLQDFLYIIFKHPIQDFKISEIIFKIKGYSELSLPQIMKIISWQPKTCAKPFTEYANLPSYSFRLKTNLIGQIQDVLNHKRSLNNVFKIKLVQAVSVPSSFRFDMIIRREVVVAIYDKFYQRFIENSIVMKATATIDAKHIWNFKKEDRKNGFYLLCDNLKYSKDLFLVFEFVQYIQENNSVLKFGGCFYEIPIVQIIPIFKTKATLDLNIPLLGGYPDQSMQITPDSIDWLPPGILGTIMEKISKAPPSTFNLVISRRSERKQLSAELVELPDVCLLTRNQTYLLSAFKKYLRYAFDKQENVLNNHIINVFYYSLDCPYISKKLSSMWLRNMVNKMVGKEDRCIEIILQQLFKLTKLKDFAFNPHTPNEIINKDAANVRRETVNSILGYTEMLMDQNHFKLIDFDRELIIQDLELYGTPQQLPLYDGIDPFDPFYNGLFPDMYF